MGVSWRAQSVIILPFLQATLNQLPGIKSLRVDVPNRQVSVIHLQTLSGENMVQVLNDKLSEASLIRTGLKAPEYKTVVKAALTARSQGSPGKELVNLEVDLKAQESIIKVTGLCCASEVRIIKVRVG